MITLIDVIYRLKKVIRFEPKAVPKVLITNVFFTILAGRIIDLILNLTAPGIVSSSEVPTPELTKLIMEFNLWNLWVVGFEDLIFVLPLFVFTSYRLLLPAMVTLSVLFCLGHQYQGISAMMAKITFVPVIYLMAKKHGILTTAVSHIAQDLIAILILRYAFTQLGI